MVESGEWVFEDKMIEPLSSVIEANAMALAETGGKVDSAQVRTIFQTLPEWLGELTDFHPVSVPPTPAHDVEFRVGRGRLFRASAAADDAIMAIGSLVVAFLSAPIGSVLFFASAVPALIVARRLARYYEELEGDERKVFEAVAALAARLSIVNHDALHKEGLWTSVRIRQSNGFADCSMCRTRGARR